MGRSWVTSNASDLSIINPRRQTLPGSELLHELIARPAGDRLILDFLSSDGRRLKLSYDHFHHLTDLLARDIKKQLLAFGADSAVIPAIIPQCPELYIAWVSVLKAGAGYCPVGVDVPSERLKFIVKDVGAPFVLTTTTALGSFEKILSNVKCLPVSLLGIEKRLDSRPEDEPEPDDLPPIDPDGPAYVMYTSGSTGLPKGVKVSHRSISQSLLAHEQHIPSFKRFLQFASPTFDVSIFEIFFPFYRGVTLVGCAREQLISDLPGVIKTLDADAAELTPTVAGTLLRTREAAPCLKTLLTIGEMLTTQVVSEFGGTTDKPSMLYAMYGPTEAAVHCTLATKLDASASVRSIGRPFSTVTAFILKQTDKLEIAPFGEEGELAVAGQLADGYLNRPDQNAAAFIELPGYGPIYKTGDRAICRSDGELEIRGRISEGQVKIRGQRVELGEIEEVASKVPGVDLAVASIVDDLLVLFCASSGNAKASDVASACKSWLPSYMRPGEIVIMRDGIPRLPSGKIDRKEMQRNFRDSRTSTQEDSDFENDIEQEIAQVLEHELGCRLQRLTSLWPLGLDSLRSIKVASILRQKYSHVSATMIAESENVAELSTFVRNYDPPEEPTVEDTVDKMLTQWEEVKKIMIQRPDLISAQERPEKILPCSPMQVAMLVETSTYSHMNFNEISIRMAPEVNFEDIRKALNLLAKGTEILRSGFVATEMQELPFAQIVWSDLVDTELSLLHPLQVTDLSTSDGNQALVRIHHALYDGWSWDLILDDLNAILSGRDNPPRTQFSAFSDHQQRRRVIERSENLYYWQTAFQDFVPSSFPNLSTTTQNWKTSRSENFLLSITMKNLFGLSQSLRCSRESILESAWSLLLSSYVDSSDLAIGVVLAGRHMSMLGIETIIGPCLATLPLRIDLSTLRTVHDLIDHVQRQRVNCLRYGNLSLHDIHRGAKISPGTRLFDTMCVWQEDSVGVQRDRSKVSTIESHDALDYAIVLEFEPRDGQITMRMTFDCDKLPENHARLLAAQMDALTAQMMENVELPLESLWRVSPEGLMSLSNINYDLFEEDFDLTSTVSELARTDPQRVAIEFVDDFDPALDSVKKTRLTYGDLYEQALRVASNLKRLHTVEDDLVCVVALKSIDLYVGILGVILAGAAYLCVDVRTPVERTRQILRESKARIVLTDSNHDSNLELEKEYRLVQISDLIWGTVSGKRQNPTRCPTNKLAYAVFTSGSTGVPKGVLITRRNLLSNLRDLSRIYPCGPGQDKLLQACSPAFDVSVFEIFWTWHVGMTLCAASNDVLFRDIEAFINRFKVTHLSFTPSVAALVEAKNVPLVKMMVTAGEPMNSKVFSDWADRGLYQGYGPSETTNICNVRPAVSQQDLPRNVGPAFPNTSIFVCQRQSKVSRDGDESEQVTVECFQPIPKGTVGEIWVGGEQVGRGYIDPMLTAKSFLNHPQYGRLYRSGDIGRLLADDSLVIIGREDDQVKLRGQRLELGEINSSLIRCDFVKDAVSMIIKDQNGTDRLISFWSAPPGQSLNQENLLMKTQNLFQQLKGILPTYMIPDTLVHLESMPLTRQGKIDRRNMTALYHKLKAEELSKLSRDNKSSEDAELLSTTETKIAEVISQVLDISLDTIKRDSSFFALGLDSISAIRLSQSLKQCGYPFVDVSTILGRPSIGQLIPVMDNNHLSKQESVSSSKIVLCVDHNWETMIKARYARSGYEVEVLLPCTPLQESMLTSTTESRSKAYQNVIRFRVRGDLRRLQNAWGHATARHQLLRTGFAAVESADHPYVQVVIRDFKLPWSHGDDKTSPIKDMDHLMFPPWRIRTFRKNDGTELILEMHHALYDAEAMSTLQAEIQSLYHCRELLPPVPFELYLNFMQGCELKEQDNFWQKRLLHVAPCRLGKLLRYEDKEQSNSAFMAERNATMSLSKLRRSVKKLSTTTLAVLQSAWSRLLFYIFESQDVCFGTVFSGRNLPINGVSRIVAPCFNTVPVRARVKQNDSNHSLCRDLQLNNIDTLPFQPSSLRRIQRQHVEDGKPLFDTLLLLQQNWNRTDNEIWSLVEESGDMAFPFILEVTLIQETDHVDLKLHSQVANSQFLDKILSCYDDILGHTIAFPQARVLDRSFISGRLPEFLTHEQRLKVVNGIATKLDRVSGSSEELSTLEMQIVRVILQLKPGIDGRIRSDTTIFRLGLDSINAVQIAAGLRKLGHTISSVDILEAATIEGIASMCKTGEEAIGRQSFDLWGFDSRHRRTVCIENSIDEAGVQSVRPCTPTQAGILSQFLRSDCSLYFNTTRLGLDEGIDCARLQDSWNSIMGMHEMLRTGFVQLDEPAFPFAMVTYRHGAFPLPWSQFNSTSGSQEVAAIAAVQDLVKPPWRLRLVKNNTRLILEVSILHALYDARSLEIVLRDVGSAYEGRLPSKPTPIEPTLSKILSISSGEDSKPFWSGLSAELCSTRFPDLRVCNDSSKFFSVVEENLGLSRSDLEAKCAQAGASVQGLLVAAWSIVLSAYTAQDRVTFGVILSGRNFDTEEENNIAFPCINTVPFTVGILQNFADTLERATKRSAEVLKHQYTPLNSIKRWIGIEDELFDTVLALQKYSSGRSSSQPWTSLTDDATAEYAVSLEIFPEEQDKFRIQLTSRDNLVPLGQARHILRQFSTVVDQLLTAVSDGEPSLPLEAASVVRAEAQRISTDVRYLHEFVEATAKQQPNSTALEFVTDLQGTKSSRKSWTYAQLDSAGNQIGHLLLSEAVQASKLVAICFEKCPEASFAILGVLKAGCGYIAIDPTAPRTRKTFILDDSNCKVVLTMRELVKEFPQSKGLSVIAIDAEDWHDLPRSKPLSNESLDPQSTCYCLYTSGTTGTPKGCLISHDSAVQAMLSFRRIFKGRWDASSRWLQFASFHFDVSVLEQYWSWSVGICVTSIPRDLLFEDLPGTIASLNITHLDLTPSLARLLTPEDVPSLCRGVFIVGGEQIRQDILETWGDSGCLYNFYGPSEVTIGCTVHQNVPKSAKVTNIGQQWDNVGSFVLEPSTDKPVLRGAVGELCLSGPLVGKGYLNRPKLTAEKFVILKEYGTRVYRTGDLVRLLDDDSFDFLGRMDDQVKLRGQRLEIGEINHIIMKALSSIQDVTTMVLKHPIQKRDQLVTFFSISHGRKTNERPTIVSNQATEAAISAIKQNCINSLPAYMVPTYYFAISAIPLNVNNKIDHKLLRALFESSSLTSGVSANDEQGDVDEQVGLDKIINVVASFLQIPPSTIKPSSRLFELGLDSVSAIGLARVLTKQGYRNANVATVLKHPVIIELARTLNYENNQQNSVDLAEAQKRIISFANAHRHSVTQLLSIAKERAAFIAPCTPLQEGMISRTLQNEQESDTTYFSAFHYQLHDDIDLEKLRNTWVSVQKSSAILRTYFVSTVDGFAQVVVQDNDDNPVQLKHLQNGRKQPTVPWDRYLIDWVRSTKSFGDRLPWKVDLSTLGKRKYMSLYIFHGLYDGIGLQLLLDKIHDVYSQDKTTITEDMRFFEALPHGPLGYRPDDMKFWTSKSSTIRWLGLPLREKKDVRASVIHLRQTLTNDELQDFCNKLNVTVPAFFQAAWLYALQRFFGVNPSIGLVVSGRSIPVEDADSIVGPMFNTIPFAARHLSKDSTLTDLVQACHHFNVDAIPFQHTPLRQIARYLGQDINKGLFEALFVFQKGRKDPRMEELWQEIPTMQSSPEYPLNLEIEQNNGQFSINFLAKAANIDDVHARELMNLYVDLVRDLKSMQLPLPDEFCEMRSQQNINGSHESRRDLSSDGRSDTLKDQLAWSNTELMIRTEIAKLASMPESNIRHNSPTIFELGLDSIEAMKLAARLRDRAVKITFSTIMKAPTVAGIAQQIKISEQKATEDRDAGAFITSIANSQEFYRRGLKEQRFDVGDIQRVLPVTPMQEGLLTEPGKYFNVLVYKLRNDVDTKKLWSVLKALSTNRAILRTRFAIIESEEGEDIFVQYVTSRLPSITFVDDRVVSAVVHDLRRTAVSFDISDQTFNIRIVNDREHGTFLVLGSPHALYDAWSLQLLHEDIGKYYFSPQNGETHQGAIPYERHVQEIMDSGNSIEANQFWHDHLQEVQPCVCADHLKPPETPNGHLQTQSTPHVKLSIALDFCRQHGVTLQSLGLTVWSIALAHLVRRVDICFGLVLSGRTTEDSERLIFPTFNTAVFAFTIDESDSKRAVLKKVHDHMVRVSEYQHFPMRQALQIARAQYPDSQLFDTLFTFQKLPHATGEFPSLLDEYNLDEDDINPPFPVNVEFEGDESGLRWTIAIQNGTASANAVHDLSEMLTKVLSSIIETPDEPVVDRIAENVSFCGLSPINLGPQHPIDTNGIEDRVIDSNHTGREQSWTLMEATIRDVLARVSKTDTEQITKSIGFYHLGLDSVSAIKVSSLLKKEGIKLPVSEIIKSQTIERMADVATRLDGSLEQTTPILNDTHKQAVIPPSVLKNLDISLADIEEVFPATPGQIYMLDMWTASKGRLFYPTFWLQASGTITERLRDATSKLVKSMPMLRTRFIRDQEGEVVSVVIKETALGKYALPWSMHVQKRGIEHLITLKIHHALYDAVSLQLMVSELEELCQDSSYQVEANTKIGDFISYHSRSNDEARKTFWSDYLAEEVTKYSPHSKASFKARRVEKFHPEVLHMSQIQKMLRRYGISMQALFFAAYAHVYARKFQKEGGSDTSQPSETYVVVGVYLANRSLDLEGLTDLAAPTLNIVPLRVKIARQSLVNAARQVQRDLGEIAKQEHCGVSMRDIHAWTGVKLDTYVNFLALPARGVDDEDDGVAEENHPSKTVSITHADINREERSTTEVSDAAPPFFEGSADNLVEPEWCLPSIDVEAKVTNNYLGVGVFAPEDKLGESDIDEIVHDVRSLMLSVS